MGIRNILIVIAAAFVFTACQSSGNANVGSPGNNANGNTAQASPAAPASSELSSASPTEIYRTAHGARQRKDIETLKKIFAKDILEFFAEIGKADKKSIDDMLLEMCEKAIPGEAETRNERITGETATVEYKENDDWRLMDFVKEDGIWKMTIAKPSKIYSEGGKENK